MITRDIGRSAEQGIASYLKHNGYRILHTNWLTPQCEIDIVALKSKTVYFIEVKYRSSNSSGNGFDYITPNKMRRIIRAAYQWSHYHNWRGNKALIVAAVDNRNNATFRRIEF